MIAHAFGARYDLPVPLWLFVAGGALVVLASFALVLPRAVAAAEGPAPVPSAGHAPPVVRPAAALAVLLALVVCGIAGRDAVAENIVPTIVWLLLWVAVPVSCGVIGDWTRPVNPFAAAARLGDRDGLRHALIAGGVLPWPRRLGHWPAVGLFLAVASGELIWNDTATRPLVTAVGLLVYALLNVAAGLLFGAEAWCGRGELFSVLLATWGRLGYFRLGAPGRTGVLGGLAVPFEASVSRITFTLLLLVSVTFDGLLATPAWKSTRPRLPGSFAPGTIGYQLGELAALLGLVGVAWLLFGGFALAVRRAGRLEAGGIGVLAGLLPSLVPISFGYLVAHNLEYLAINGQLLVPLLGDPAGQGWHLLPHPFDDSYRVDLNLLPSAVAWYLEVVLIVAVHVAAVVLAHRHLAGAARSRTLAQRSEWPWIVAMVGYTMSSLWLLAQPLVEEGRGGAAALVHPGPSPVGTLPPVTAPTTVAATVAPATEGV